MVWIAGTFGVGRVVAGNYLTLSTCLGTQWLMRGDEPKVEQFVHRGVTWVGVFCRKARRRFVDGTSLQ